MRRHFRVTQGLVDVLSHLHRSMKHRHIILLSYQDVK